MSKMIWGEGGGGTSQKINRKHTENLQITFGKIFKRVYFYLYNIALRHTNS